MLIKLVSSKVDSSGETVITLSDKSVWSKSLPLQARTQRQLAQFRLEFNENFNNGTALEIQNMLDMYGWRECVSER